MLSLEERCGVTSDGTGQKKAIGGRTCEHDGGTQKKGSRTEEKKFLGGAFLHRQKKRNGEWRNPRDWASLNQNLNKVKQHS